MQINWGDGEGRALCENERVDAKGGGIKMFKCCRRIWVHPTLVIFADFTGFEYGFF